MCGKATDEYRCEDCQEYEVVDAENGLCGLTGLPPGYRGVCPPRRRELEALKEVERLRGKLEEMADILSPTVSRPGVPSLLYCPPLHECPEDLSISCRQCWQMWIDA